MTPQSWQVLSRRRVFSGGPVREIAVETVRLPDGRVIDDYYAIQLPDYVLIYPEMIDGRVSVLRQYRHGLRRVCVGFPGGAIEPGESPLEAARRELYEELGCEAAEWHHLGSLGSNGNQGCNTAHLFRAAGCRVISRPPAPDVEAAEVLTVTGDELLGQQDVVEQIGLASHLALLLLATNPRFRGRLR